MDTLVFESYEDFIEVSATLDEKINGVSPVFSERYPDYRAMNLTNESCWDCTDCIDCERCYKCELCEDCEECNHCVGLKNEFGKSFIFSVIDLKKHSRRAEALIEEAIDAKLRRDQKNKKSLFKRIVAFLRSLPSAAAWAIYR